MVDEVLRELGASDKPMIEALNKCDKDETDFPLETGGAIRISAKDGTGLDRLKAAISEKIAAMRHRVDLLIPYDKGAVLSLIHNKGQVLSEEYTQSGTQISCLLDAVLYARVLKELERA